MRAKLICESLKKDIIITLPANTDWAQYNVELNKVKDFKSVMNFKVPNLPKDSGIGCKCYLNYKGYIIGWMQIVGFEEKDFTCSTTGKEWKGKFIQRSGPFNKITPIPMKGFRGFKYMN